MRKSQRTPYMPTPSPRAVPVIAEPSPLLAFAIVGAVALGYGLIAGIIIGKVFL